MIKLIKKKYCNIKFIEQNNAQIHKIIDYLIIQVISKIKIKIKDQIAMIQSIIFF